MKIDSLSLNDKEDYNIMIKTFLQILLVGAVSTCAVLVATGCIYPSIETGIIIFIATILGVVGINGIDK